MTDAPPAPPDLSDLSPDEPRVWLITGATSGFGRAIAQAALARGDTVVAAVRRPDAVEAAPRLHAVRLDLSQREGIEVVVDRVITRFGRIDVLVNNAGRGLVGAVEETTDEELRDLMQLHLFGPVALTRAVLPSMRAVGSGVIVQLSSQGGRLSFPGVGAYSATKFALEGWSQALAQEVRPFGIRVLVVEPGAFRTSFNGPSALQTSAPMPEYEDIVGPVRRTLSEGDGRQPGDPDRAAAAILTALDAEDGPLRLPLGSDAYAAIDADMAAMRAEFEKWESLTRSADFPDEGKRS